MNYFPNTLQKQVINLISPYNLVGNQLQITKHLEELRAKGVGVAVIDV